MAGPEFLSAFPRLLAESCERVLFSDTPIQGTNKLAVLLGMLRKERDRLPIEVFRRDMLNDSAESAANFLKLLPDLSDVLKLHFSHSRVFCVSESADHTVMWSHYADEHRGVVFKLRCVEEIDHPLLIAQKVNYSDTFIPFFGADEYASHLTGEGPLDIAELAWKIAFTKHKDWAYEREWRLHKPMLNNPPGDGYSIFPEDERVFEEIYLGCRMSPDHAQRLIDAARTSIPRARIFQTVKSRTGFRLEFQEVQ